MFYLDIKTVVLITQTSSHLTNLSYTSVINILLCIQGILR